MTVFKLFESLRTKLHKSGKEQGAKCQKDVIAQIRKQFQMPSINYRGLE